MKKVSVKELKLTEAIQLSAKDKEALRKIRDKLINTVNLTEDEADYYVGFYSALKKQGFLEVNQMKNYDTLGYSFKDKKMPDSIRNTFKSPQSYTNKPQLFYKILLTLLNNNALLNKFEIAIGLEADESFNIYSVDLVAKTEVPKNLVKTVDKLTSTKWDKFKVGEDSNWITFKIDKFSDTTIDNSNMFNFYLSHWDKDLPSIKECIKAVGSSFIQTSWCVLSSSHHFSGQKSRRKDWSWLVTFSKHSPADIILEEIQRRHPKNKDAKMSDFYALNEKDRHGIRDQLGEIYLLTPDSPASDGVNNVGFHCFSNFPNGGVKTTKLLNPPSYLYTDLKVSDSSEEEFVTDGVKLLAYNGSEDFVVLPQGLRIIDSGAFKNRTNLRELVLPYTLQYIDEDAFINCPNLQVIRAYNGLRHINIDAFKEASLTDKITFGVFSVNSKNEYIVKKPKALQIFPKDVFLIPEQPLTEKRKRRTEAQQKEDDIIVSPLDYMDNDVYVFNGKLKFINKNMKENTYSVQNGITSLTGDIPSSIKTLYLPQSFTTLKAEQFKSATLRNVSLKDTQVDQLPAECFKKSEIRTVELPVNLQVIEREAFANCRFLSEITIPISTRIIDKTAFNGSGFLEVLYTKDPVKLEKVLDSDVRLAFDVEYSKDAY